WSIRNPIAPLLSFCLLVFIGIQSFNSLPITRFPNISARLGHDLVAGLQSFNDLEIGTILDAGLDLGVFYHTILDPAGGGAFVTGEH
ncbi:hypothetical protein, partial [Rhizobium leguminosarum]|uniref:hypothetical protein n=1 Tax=Rhizobium leguminosarum TaxID=384 RepID=UPI003F963924